MNMSTVKIIRRPGARGTELWVDGKMIAKDVTSYTLTQNGGDIPVLVYTGEVWVDDLNVEVEADVKHV